MESNFNPENHGHIFYSYGFLRVYCHRCPTEPSVQIGSTAIRGPQGTARAIEMLRAHLLHAHKLC